MNSIAAIATAAGRENDFLRLLEWLLAPMASCLPDFME
jgi:hypothetical protein